MTWTDTNAGMAEMLLSRFTDTPVPVRTFILSQARELDARSWSEMGFPNVNRVEVIDPTGRAYVMWKEGISVRISMQDGGRTMKVFIEEKKDGRDRSAQAGPDAPAGH